MNLLIVRSARLVRERSSYPSGEHVEFVSLALDSQKIESAVEGWSEWGNLDTPNSKAGKGLYDHRFVRALSLFWVALALALSPFTARSSWAIDLLRDSKSFVGRGYLLGSEPRELLFHLERKLAEDSRSAQAVFRDLEGKELVREITRFNEQMEVVSYEVIQHQTGEQGKIEVSGERLRFTKTVNGKTRVTDEELVSNWVVGPSLVPLLVMRWPEIEQGKKIQVRLALWDRQETVGFELFKDRLETGSDGKERLIVKMKPSNFLISALVNPIYFGFGKDGRSLDWVHGRVLPKRPVGSKLKDLDAELIYAVDPGK